MAKKNITIQHFDRPNALDGTYLTLGPTDTPESREPIMRLGWNKHEGPCDWEALAAMIGDSSLPEAAFFLDSSFFDRHEIPWHVWQSLLSRKIVFTQMVWDELSDWRATPFANLAIRDSLLQLREDADTRVEILDTTAWPDPRRKNARRYAELLCCRKLIGLSLLEQFKEEYAREPTNDELGSRLQKIVRDRGLTLAKKGIADVSKPNLMADEQIVVCAIAFAISTGRETSILTRDVDLIEQFYKAIYLLDTDYRSFLVGKQFQESPENLISRSIEGGGLDGVFEGGSAQILHLPRRFKDWVLPDAGEWVNVSCKRLGGHAEQMKVSSLTFCADKDMVQVLDDDLPDEEGKRVRICISPPFAEQLGGHAVVGKEKTSQFGPWRHSNLDYYYALREIERFQRAEVNPSVKSPNDSLGVALGTFRLEERLMFSEQPVWHSFREEELADAIRYSEPSAIILCDGSMLRSDLASFIARPLVERRFGSTEKILDSASDNEIPIPLLRDVVQQRKGKLDVYSISEGDRRLGFEYYLSLIAFRKMYGTTIQRQVELEYGRSSPPEEWPQIVEHYAGIRGRLLAEHGELRRSDPTLYHSDEMLVKGLILSVAEGADVIFVTVDPNIMDQFVKLCTLVSQHYLAYCVGHRMEEDPQRFSTYQPPSKPGQPIALCHDLRRGWQSEVLPSNPYFLNLHCWLIAPGPHLCAFSFCAERPMRNILETKGKTNGLNVDRSDGRNLRLAQVCGGDVAILAEDERIEFGTWQLPSDERIGVSLDSLPKNDLANIVNQKEIVDPVWFSNPGVK